MIIKIQNSNLHFCHLQKKTKHSYTQTHTHKHTDAHAHPTATPAQNQITQSQAHLLTHTHTNTHTHTINDTYNYLVIHTNMFADVNLFFFRIKTKKGCAIDKKNYQTQRKNKNAD